MFKEGCRQSAGQEESLPIQCLPVFLASVIDSGKYHLKDFLSYDE